MRNANNKTPDLLTDEQIDQLVEDYFAELDAAEEADRIAQAMFGGSK